MQRVLVSIAASFMFPLVAVAQPVAQRPSAAPVLSTAQPVVTLKSHDDRVTVLIDDELFTEYVFKGYEKPILYPVIGPTGARMTRDYPMKKGTPDEAEDHPHHKSIWFGHGAVNDQDFWAAGNTSGTTEHDHLSVENDTIIATNRLIDSNGKLVATDTRTIRFTADGATRTIDYAVAYHATESDLVFGDTKEGQMGIRMHRNLRVKGPTAGGHAINANGEREKEIWGKRAPWIDYWGEVDGKTVGIAMFDHPTNLRHPNWWHARDYGLLSANPFGVHDFEHLEDENAGNYTLAKGEKLTFKHRIVFHTGDFESAGIDALYKAWTSSQ